MTRQTDEVRAILAALLEVPDVSHYAVAARVPGGLVHCFCGLPGDAIILHAQAVQFLAVNQADLEADKLSKGCTRCGYP